MGFAWSGVCYPDASKALQAFVRDVPSADSSGINTFASVPTIDETGQINWLIANRAFSGAAPNVVSGTTQLLTCAEDASLLPSSWSTGELVLIVGMLLMFASGFKAGYHR